MIVLYYWTTPNGHKITIFLEEAKLPYRIVPINIGKGEQFAPEFLKIAPNNRIPAIIDETPNNTNKPLSLFESGAILLYLADKTKQFIPNDIVGRNNTIQWLFWQMAGLGPMSGQYNHFANYAAEKIPYAIERYTKEVNRLYAVLDKQLANNEYIAGAYSIADMACYTWIPYQSRPQSIEAFPHLTRWCQQLQERTAIKRAYAIAKEINPEQGMTEEAKRFLFGQDANTIPKSQK